jgi:hypothetical protein
MVDASDTEAFGHKLESIEGLNHGDTDVARPGHAIEVAR